ncbi:MAG: leucine-rich repeat domain-containing protein [Simkaniaceae bacterium]|nr:leucine-rich repeat domain-containing protein [Simkaniaceae bacterium]
MAAPTSLLESLPVEILQNHLLPMIDEPGTTRILSKFLKDQTDAMTTRELKRISRYLHPTQEPHVTRMQSLYQRTIMNAPKNAANHLQQVSLERFIELKKIAGTLEFWSHLPNGKDAADPRNFIGLSLEDLEQELEAWIINLPPENPITTLTILDTIYDIPPQIGSLKELKEFTYRSVTSKEIPSQIGCLQKLQTLNLSFCPLESLPEEIGGLKQLKKLFLSFNHLQHLPKEIENLKQLEELDLSHYPLKQLPEELGSLDLLKKLTLYNTRLTKLPSSFETKTSLKLLLAPGDIAGISASTAWAFFSLSDKQKESVYRTIGSNGQERGKPVPESGWVSYGRYYVFSSEEKLLQAMKEL